MAAHVFARRVTRYAGLWGSGVCLGEATKAAEGCGILEKGRSGGFFTLGTEVKVLRASGRAWLSTTRNLILSRSELGTCSGRVTKDADLCCCLGETCTKLILAPRGWSLSQAREWSCTLSHAAELGRTGGPHFGFVGLKLLRPRIGAAFRKKVGLECFKTGEVRWKL